MYYFNKYPNISSNLNIIKINIDYLNYQLGLTFLISIKLMIKLIFFKKKKNIFIINN